MWCTNAQHASLLPLSLTLPLAGSSRKVREAPHVELPGERTELLQLEIGRRRLHEGITIVDPERRSIVDPRDDGVVGLLHQAVQRVRKVVLGRVVVGLDEPEDVGGGHRHRHRHRSHVLIR